MYIINRALIEINNAIKLSRSSLPQEKQLAVIIFDHLIEIVLFNAAKSAFIWGIPTSITSVKLDSNTKKNTLYKYDSVIKFAKKLNHLDEQDESLLTFAHNIRNELYHKGDTKIDNTILALVIYFHFISKNKRLLITQHGLSVISGEKGYEQIDFGQKLNKKDPMYRLNISDYANDAIDYLVSTFPSFDKFQNLASEYLKKIIERIENDIDYIKTTSKEINFYDAISTSTLGDTAPIFKEFSHKKRKPKTIDSILLTSAFFRLYEDQLNDFSTTKERYTRSKSFFTLTRKGKNQKYQNWININRVKIRAEKLKNEKIEISIQNFNGLNNLVKELCIDLEFATGMFSGYETFLYDLYRGK